ncbi:hypothetical protein P4S68_11460 [Pseudoalteromonas sp. Hal099]
MAAFAAGGAGAAVGGSLGAAIGAFIPEHEVKFTKTPLKKALYWLVLKL